MRQKGFTLLPMIIIILIGVVGYLVYKNKLPSTLNPTNFVSCSKSGFLPKNEYLPLYTVKQGDTLLSISKNVLNDVSRIDEIIKLNKDDFPELSIKNPFLEKDWVLKLPPENSSKTNGSIYAVAGRLSVSNVGWGVNWLNAGVGPFSLTELPTSFSSGQCVIVIYQSSDMDNPSPIKVFSVKLGE